MINISRHPDGGYLLESELQISRRREQVFPFFADAKNLERLTPDLLKFQIVTPTPIEMKKGALIDYRLKVHGIPMKWRSEITVWNPPFEFVDEQLKGPYRIWRHHHLFEEDGDKTIVRDVVLYDVPGGSLVHSLFVQRDVKRIFAHRHEILHDLFTEA